MCFLSLISFETTLLISFLFPSRYCDREFDDEKILINHQKAKHFKCYQCHKKLTTASGLAIHLYSVHKETITTVPNAKEGRDALKPDIIGMEGVPDDAIRGHAEGGSDDEVRFDEHLCGI